MGIHFIERLGITGSKPKSNEYKNTVKNSRNKIEIRNIEYSQEKIS